MRVLQEIAESLENKRLIALRLNLFGFAMGGLFRIIDTWFLPVSGNSVLLVLQLVGAGLWLISLIQLLLIRSKINKDEKLKRLFNDELSAQNRLKTWKVGFVAVMVVQVVLILVSLFNNYNALMAVEITVYVALCAVLGASIVQEELLSITLFRMEIDKEKYEVWNWRTFSFFHWIINPGVGIVELIFGQRVPKVMLIDRMSEKPLMERTYIPCPHCETMHNNAMWSHKNKNVYRNWYGLYCPSCGEIIPCLSNVLTRIVRAVTYPLWFWRKDFLKEKWIEKQRLRSQDIDTAGTLYKEVNWTRMGLIFGTSMFAMMILFGLGFLHFFDNGKLKELLPTYTTWYITVNLIVSSLSGWAFAFLLKLILGMRGRRAKSDSQNQTA
ncbi:MAG: hypothetical protein HEP71_10180 [Roseivirga sp.]|nr:hypothetical protein [Roseivirga sp.]